MSPLTVSRILFVLLLVNEAVVVIKTPPEERGKMRLPRLGAPGLLSMFPPLFIALDYPDWLGWILAVIQGARLALEVAAEFQLSRKNTYSVTAITPNEPQTTGFYAIMENPIYLGILIQFFAWGLWMPLALIHAVLTWDLLRTMVPQEREELAKLNIVNRGIDSPLWN
jgi:protein-S-isoprenylcysteine O-methyltransferase Ste14